MVQWMFKSTRSIYGGGYQERINVRFKKTIDILLSIASKGNATNFGDLKWIARDGGEQVANQQEVFCWWIY